MWGGRGAGGGAVTWPEAPPTPSGMCRWWEGSDAFSQAQGSLRGRAGPAPLGKAVPAWLRWQHRAAPTDDQWSQITFRRARARTRIMAGLNKQMGRWGRGGSLTNPPRTAPAGAAVSGSSKHPRQARGPARGTQAPGAAALKKHRESEPSASQRPSPLTGKCFQLQRERLKSA